MKKLIVFSLSLSIAFCASAQSNLRILGMKVTKFGTSYGFDQDMLDGLGQEYLLKTARGDASGDFSNLNFEDSDLMAMACENPNVRFDMTLQPNFIKNTDLRISLAGMFNRIEDVHYQNGASSLNISSINNEIGFETSLVKNANLGNFLHFYGGFGTNAGVSFMGQMWVDQYNENTIATQEEPVVIDDPVLPQINVIERDNSREYDLKSGFHNRFFVEGGVGLRFFKRMELGVEGKYGLGYRVVAGAPLRHTKTLSLGIYTRWVLK